MADRWKGPGGRGSGQQQNIRSSRPPFGQQTSASQLQGPPPQQWDPPQSHRPRGPSQQWGPPQSQPPRGPPQQWGPPQSQPPCGPPQSRPPQQLGSLQSQPPRGPPQQWGPPQSQPPRGPPQQWGPPQSQPPRGPPQQLGPPQSQPPRGPSQQWGPPQSLPPRGLPQQWGPPQSQPPRGPSQQFDPPRGPSQQFDPPRGPSQQFDPPQDATQEPHEEKPFEPLVTSQQLAPPQASTQEPTVSASEDQQDVGNKRRKGKKKGGKAESQVENENQAVSTVESQVAPPRKHVASEETPKEPEKPPKGLEKQKPSEQIEQPTPQKSNLPSIPKRKSTGTVGQAFQVDANFLPLTVKNQDLIVYHYDVDITPDKSLRMKKTPRRLFKRAIQMMKAKHFNNRFPAFDNGKNLYVAAPPLKLKNNTVTDMVEVTDEESNRSKQLIVTIKLAGEVSLKTVFDYMKNGHSFDKSQKSSIQAMDVALRSGPTSITVTVGRSFFTKPRGTFDRVRDLGDGLELWDGMFQSCVLGWKTCYLNVDVAHKGFPRHMNVVTYFETYCKFSDDTRPGLSPRGFNKATKFLTGLKIEYNMGENKKMTFKLAQLGKPPRLAKFMKDDREITVYDYFANERRCSLKYTEFPCLQTQSKALIPPELCTIAQGQALNRKLTETQTAKMVRYAAKPADLRRERINDFIHTVKFNEDPCLKEFGITVDEKFTTVNARILPPPALEYRNGAVVVPREGVWKPDKFLDGKVLDKWLVLNLDSRTTSPTTVDHFVRELVNAGQTVGMNVLDTRLRERSPDANLNTLTRKFDDLKHRYPDIKLVVVIIPDYPPGAYGCVKRAAELTCKGAAELTCGIVTQCVKGKTLGKMNFSTASNILLKINTKLNGINHKLTAKNQLVLSEPIMIVGADVTHPSSDQCETPSIAAVVASFDKFAYRYMSQYRLQPARMEIIQDMENIMFGMLTKFYERTERMPRKIIFFRDGVGEGQFEEVKISEVRAIQQACKRIASENYEPGITFVVVQKRHHTRFFPRDDSRIARGRNFNVPPGTIVDVDITHPTEFDFYLVSHASIQGTARPTKYHMIHDDNNFDADTLQLLAYNLCHLFARCNRAVSYPAPTYYAHLIAFRCRAYMEQTRLQVGEMQDLDTERHCGLVCDNILRDTPMFFV